jgi:hypothetical protein
MAKPRTLIRPEEHREPLPGEGHLCGPGLRTFAVWFRPNFALVCEPDQPLRYNRRVVVRINVDGSPTYFEGKVLTKRPTQAKSVDVLLNNGGLVRRARKADLAPVVGEHDCRVVVRPAWALAQELAPGVPLELRKRRRPS